jgi:hypothetical protein
MNADSVVAQIDRLIEQALVNTEVLLLEHGATPEEFESFMRHHHLELLAWRRQTLRQIRELSDGGLP